jgi:uncharacterized protein (DUF2141 family)
LFSALAARIAAKSSLAKRLIRNDMLPAMTHHPHLPRFAWRLMALAALILVAAFGTRPAAAADLTIYVDAIRNDHGRVYVTLFNSASTWLDGKQSTQDDSVPAHPGQVSVTFHNVAPGRYAAVVFHDENGNTVMDYDLIGLPTEGFAFSNMARPFLSAPSFDRCAFEMGSQNAQISIKMIYP